MQTSDIDLNVLKDFKLSFMQIDQIRVPWLIEQMENQAATFLNEDPNEFHLLGTDERVLYLANTFTSLFLIQNNQVKARFRDLGLPEKCLDWFINLTDLLNELEKINQHECIFAYTPMCILIINQYVFYKVLNEIFHGFGLVKKIKKGKDIQYRNLLNHETLKFFDRKKDSVGSQNKYLLFDSMMTRVFEKIKTDLSPIKDIGTPKKLQDHFSKLTRGNPEYFYLQLLLEQAITRIDTKKPDKKEYFSMLFNLIKLVTNNPNMVSEKQFDTKQYGAYGHDYNYYKVQIVEQVVYGRMPRFPAN